MSRRKKYSLFAMLLAVSFFCLSFSLRPPEVSHRLTIIYSGNTWGHVKPCPT